jgi:hypothetical protein
MKFTLAVLALGSAIMLAMSDPLAAAQTTNPNVHSPSGHTISVPPQKHSNYTCTGGTCTCTNAKDCATMGADHVCVEGTFSKGTCTEKKP